MSPQAQREVRRFLDRHFRPWCVVIDDGRRWDPQNPAVWPSPWLNDADTRKLRLGFLAASDEQERAFQQIVVTWVALRWGRLKAFDSYEFPFRRCWPGPSRGRVPYIVTADEQQLSEKPLLIDELWTSRFLLGDAVLPERLHPYLVDALGFSTGLTIEDSFRRTARAELERLSAKL